MQPHCRFTSAEVATIVDGIEILEDHAHSVDRVYPTIGAGGAWVAGTSVPAGAAGAGNFGVATTILPGAATAAPFDIHYINVESLPANTTYELVILANGVESGRVRFTRVNNNESVNGLPFMMPIVAAGTVMTAKCANAAGSVNNIVISVQYHLY